MKGEGVERRYVLASDVGKELQEERWVVGTIVSGAVYLNAIDGIEKRERFLTESLARASQSQSVFIPAYERRRSLGMPGVGSAADPVDNDGRIAIEDQLVDVVAEFGREFCER